MRLKIIFTYTLFLFWANIHAQTDTLRLKLFFQKESRVLHVEQYFDIPQIEGKQEAYLYTWANAYKKDSKLSELHLSYRNDKMHFAKNINLGGISNLIFYKDKPTYKLKSKQETPELVKIKNIKAKDNRLKFSASYDLKIPHRAFTGYGVDENNNRYLKYFFLQPAVFENGKIKEQHFRARESLSANNTYYEVKVYGLEKGVEIYTDLEEQGKGEYSGTDRGFFELMLSPKKKLPEVEARGATAVLQQTIPVQDSMIFQEAVKRELNFMTKYTIPLEEPLFISDKKKRDYRFFRVKDIKIPVLGKYRVFNDYDRIDLANFTSVITTYLDRVLLLNKREDHWVMNGLATYYEMKYLEKYHKKTLWYGKIPEDVSLWGIHPIKWFVSSKFNIVEKYPITYRYFMKQNIDQPIDTPFDKLSHANQKKVSGIKTALMFEYINSYLGNNELDSLVKSFIQENKGKPVSKEIFEQFLRKNASKNLDWFFKEAIKKSGQMEFAIRSVSKKKDSVRVRVVNKTDFSGPTELVVENQGARVYSKWFSGEQKKTELWFPKMEYDKIKLMHGKYLPEKNEYNSIYVKNKLLKTKFKSSPVGDIQVPQYHQLFLWPELAWNNYDKLLLGVSITNKTLYPQQVEFKLTPLYSFGRNSTEGGASLRYRITPKNSFIRRISLSGGIAQRHFSETQEYFNYSGGVSFNFRRKVGSTVSRGFGVTYNDIQRDLSPEPTPREIELQRYRLLNVRLTHNDYNMLFERHSFLNYQYSNKFVKLMGEYYLQWKFSKKKKLGLRIFGGIFLKHDLEETTFYDFGLDHITDYMYNYNLYGRSETSGILSQQFVLAEGGFKSNFGVRANDYMLAFNLEYPIVKHVDFYADISMYKNKQYPTKVVYDTGIRLKIVPDFVEFYFPLQSSLGFEPAQADYYNKVRFLLNVNLSKIKRYWRNRRFEL